MVVVLNDTLSIIGAGKVGKTLGKLWLARKSLRLQDVFNRTQAGAGNATEFIGGGRPVSDYAALQPADIYLIATPDDRIATTCAALAEAGLLSPSSIVFHCSGALPSTVLRAAIDRGAAVASVHPIRSFAAPELVVQNFAGTWCGVEGDRRALDVLIPAFENIGANMVAINSDAKIHYHAGAVFACNYLVTLLDVATQSYARAGIAPDIALQMMAPLVRETVDNAFRLGPEAALTGPVARGDLATATLQWQAVAAADAKHGQLYEQLMRLTAELAARRQPPSK
jgi:predicted short-subunit dehydrogenase-like oxidoreductase (DUF2520 family)